MLLVKIGRARVLPRKVLPLQAFGMRRPRVLCPSWTDDASSMERTIVEKTKELVRAELRLKHARALEDKAKTGGHFANCRLCDGQRPTLQQHCDSRSSDAAVAPHSERALRPPLAPQQQSLEATATSMTLLVVLTTILEWCRSVAWNRELIKICAFFFKSQRGAEWYAFRYAVPDVALVN